MKLNKKIKSAPVFNHHGVKAVKSNFVNQLRRTVCATMLWEDTFYEDGKAIADRIAELVPKVPAQVAANLAVELRTQGKLRHAPLKIVREMARTESHKYLVAETLEKIIQRPDELGEMIQIYQSEKKQPLSAQLKKGLARAFTKFTPYQLSKYSGKNSNYSLKDVLFLCHAKPKDKEQAKTWKKLIDGTLESADTWENRLSASKGENKKEIWADLLKENKMGAMAILRNLRNFREQNVPDSLVKEALRKINVERVLPFRFITAAKYAPNLEPELEEAMLKCLDFKEKIKSRTCILLDLSGSMRKPISSKSELSRMDAACALAILARELFEDVRIFSFSTNIVEVPKRRGFALRDAIVNSQPHSSTDLAKAMNHINSLGFERLVCFSDEETQTSLPKTHPGKSYMINVSSSQYGITNGSWLSISGFSESVLQYIIEMERIENES